MILNKIVPTGGTKICSTAAGTSFAVTAAWFCNTSDTTTEILDVHLVAAGASVADAALIVCKAQVKPTDTMVLDTEKIVLENGDYLYASSANGTISATVSAMKL